MTLYTNQSGQNSLHAALLVHAKNKKTLKIASAFFSFDDVLFEIARGGVRINIVVRLGEGTSLEALRAILGHEDIQVRYYNSRRFHPKFYIFDDSVAIVGSANLTKSGFTTNNEAAVTLSGGADEFDQLVSLFSLYWDNARPLDELALNQAARVFENIPVIKYDPEKELQKLLGEVAVPSESVVRKDKSKFRSYVEEYERSYQNFQRGFQRVRKIYEDAGKRKVSGDILPLRIEIDQFWNFIRKNLATGDIYNEQPVRSGEELTNFTKGVLEKWFEEKFEYLNTVVENYALINKRFASEASIRALSLGEIFDTLCICHAFYEQMRHHAGGTPSFKAAFLRDNSEEEVKETLCYLLFGRDRFSERMAHCIFGAYKLKHVGRSSVQELLGWVNKEEIPICNLRTLMALRYLGAIDGIY